MKTGRLRKDEISLEDVLKTYYFNNPGQILIYDEENETYYPLDINTFQAAIASCSEDNKPATSEIIEKGRKIKIVCECFNISMKAAALQFPFNHPSVASTIPGARSAEEISENIELFNTSIPKAFWEELKSEGLIDENTPIDN